MSKERLIKLCQQAEDYAERAQDMAGEDRKNMLLIAVAKLVAAVDDFSKLKPRAKILPFRRKP